MEGREFEMVDGAVFVYGHWSHENGQRSSVGDWRHLPSDR